MYIPLFALLLGSISLPSALGWGAAGHEIVATIAQIHLHPSVFPVLCDILDFSSPDPNAPLCHLAPVAAWADRVRYNMRWSAPLHYIGAVGDHPSQTCMFPGSNGWAGAKYHNVLGAVRNVTDILDGYVSRRSVSHDAANEALKFLIHFLGDLHMPLHLTGRDRGGNSMKVRFGGRATNLHSVWDGLLVAKAIRETPYNYTYPLPSRQIEQSLRGTIYDAYVRRIMWEGILSKWKDELPSWLSCPNSAPEVTQQRKDADTHTNLWQTVLSNFYIPNGRRSIADDTDDDVICPYHWAEPIHELNCEIIWPPELDKPPYGGHVRFGGHSRAENLHDYHKDIHEDHEAEGLENPPLFQLDTPEYAGLISERMIVEKLFAQAGIRLAATLNWLFADDDDQLHGKVGFVIQH